MSEPIFRWDHKTKPSTCVITADGKELFRGSYEEANEEMERLEDAYSDSISDTI